MDLLWKALYFNSHDYRTKNALHHLHHPNSPPTAEVCALHSTLSYNVSFIDFATKDSEEKPYGIHVKWHVKGKNAFSYHARWNRLCVQRCYTIWFSQFENIIAPPLKKWEIAWGSGHICTLIREENTIKSLCPFKILMNWWFVGQLFFFFLLWTYCTCRYKPVSAAVSWR